MKKLIVIALLVLAPLSVSAEEAAMVPVNVDISNTASLQRGAKYFVNYCMGCHSAHYVRYNRLGADLGLSDTELENYLMPAGAKPFDTMDSAMPTSDSEKWFGRTPPDLSLEARSRGTDWIYNYLRSFYVDPKAATGANNLVLPNAAMPDVLWEMQGLQKAVYTSGKDGESGGAQSFDHFEQVSKGKLTPEQFDQMDYDITNFLSYISEPVQLERRNLGLKVIGFLILFFLFGYMLKREIWKNVH